MKSCAIRLAVPEDGERIGLIHYQAWMETYTGLIPQEYLATRSAEKSALIFRENKCKHLVVAECNGFIVGFCGFGAIRDNVTYKNLGEIQGIYLLEEYKRKHLGQKMMAYALEQLKNSGYTEVGLWVLEANIHAIRFYEKQGFIYSGTSKEVSLGKPMVEQLYIKRL